MLYTGPFYLGIKTQTGIVWQQLTALTASTETISALPPIHNGITELGITESAPLPESGITESPIIELTAFTAQC